MLLTDDRMNTELRTRFMHFAKRSDEWNSRCKWGIRGILFRFTISFFSYYSNYCHDVSLLNRLDEETKKRSSVTMSAALTNCLKLWIKATCLFKQNPFWETKLTLLLLLREMTNSTTNMASYRDRKEAIIFDENHKMLLLIRTLKSDPLWCFE